MNVSSPFSFRAWPDFASGNHLLSHRMLVNFLFRGNITHRDYIVIKGTWARQYDMPRKRSRNPSRHPWSLSSLSSYVLSYSPFIAARYGMTDRLLSSHLWRQVIRLLGGLTLHPVNSVPSTSSCSFASSTPPLPRTESLRAACARTTDNGSARVRVERWAQVPK